MSVAIEPRFCGPPGYANGGYSCGTFAALAGRPTRATVTLRKPVPLAAPVSGRADADLFRVTNGKGEMVAEVEPSEPLTLEPPARPDLETARGAVAGSPFLTAEHSYPGCFVCGPEHDSGFGIHVGELEGHPGVAAAPFEPPPDLLDERGLLPTELVWAALDCPSYVPSLWESPVLLGRLSADIEGPVSGDEPLVSVGWELSRRGRKLGSAAALLDAGGRVLARSQALWIRLSGN